MKDLSELAAGLDVKPVKRRQRLRRGWFDSRLFMVPRLSANEKRPLLVRLKAAAPVSNDFELFRLRARRGSLPAHLRADCDKAIASLALLQETTKAGGACTQVFPQISQMNADSVSEKSAKIGGICG